MAIQPNPLFVPPHPFRRPHTLDLEAQKAFVKKVWPQVYTGDSYAQIHRYNPQATISPQRLASTPDDDQ